MKKTLRMTVMVCLAVLTLLQAQLTVLAAGAKKEEATQIVADNSVNYGTISSSSQVDWYYLETGTENAYYSFTIHNESGTSGLHLVLYSERNEQLLHIGNGISAGTERTDSIKLLPETKYIIKMYFYQGGKGNYYFRAESQIDAAGESKDTALEVSVNQWVQGAIEGAGDLDYYVFQTGSSEQEYLVEFTNISGTTNGHVLIYSARDEKLLDVGYYTGAGSTANETIKLNPNSTYYAVAYLNEDGTGQYSFLVTQCIDGHTKGDEWITVVEPTCTEKGQQAKCCTVCGEIMDTKEIKAKGHTLESWQITKESTWLSLGEKTSPCSECPEIVTKKDYSKVWILPVVILVSILALVGIVNYIRTFFNR